MKIDDALEREIDAVMEDKAVTNVSGWTIPNSDCKCEEAAYRERLEKNASILFEKFVDILPRLKAGEDVKVSALD